ncbi:hypothetical protein ECCZ_22824 [Escherichia coli ECC-Z]|jgi:hypothetical protein|nr:hypothetical protein ECCZ_22824 [Escherichia coli ECC-Z]
MYYLMILLFIITVIIPVYLAFLSRNNLKKYKDALASIENIRKKNSEHFAEKAKALRYR